MLTARRGKKVRLTGEAAKWWKGQSVYMDLNTNLPYAFNTVVGFFMYLTPCCYAAATASDPDAGIYCKSCYQNVPYLCGTGPDAEEI